jgi:hypothetical protein
MYLYEKQGQIQNGKNKAYSLTDEKSFNLDSMSRGLIPMG